MVWQRGPFVLLLLGVSSPSIHWPASFSPSIEHRWILKILTLVCCLSTLETLGSSVEKLQLELCLTCGRHCFGFVCSSMLVSNGSSAPHLSNHELLRQCGVAWRRSVLRGFWSPSFFTGPFSFRVSFPLFGFLIFLLPRVSVGFRSGEWADTTIDDQQTILKTITIRRRGSPDHHRWRHWT